MKVGVPGEFHEDRWQRTAEDSERLCSRAHGKQAVPIEFKLSRGKAFFWPIFGTATMPTSTSVASSRGEEGLLTGLRHDDLAYRHLRAIPACQRGFKAEKKQ